MRVFVMVLQKCCNFLASAQLLSIVLLLTCVFRTIATSDESDFDSDTMASSWAIRIPLKDGIGNEYLHKMAKQIARETGLSFHGQIGGLRGHFLLVHETFYRENNWSNLSDIKDVLHRITKQLQRHPEIEWSIRERVRQRYKRSLRFKDQYFPSQWHLVSWFEYRLYNESPPSPPIPPKEEFPNEACLVNDNS